MLNAIRSLDWKFVNVLMLSFGSLLLFTAFQTTAIIQKTVMESIRAEDPTFQADGYTNLAIIYGMYALCNWIAPSVISVLTPKWTMVVAMLPYLMFMASFLRPSTTLMYVISALLGLGASLYWTSQGNLLTLCSDKKTIVRNSGILVAAMQASLLFGNLYVFFEFRGQTIIGESTRFKVFSALLGVGIAAQITFIHLRSVTEHSKAEDERKEREAQRNGAQEGHFNLGASTTSIATIETNASTMDIVALQEEKNKAMEASVSSNPRYHIQGVEMNGKILKPIHSALAINISNKIDEDSTMPKKLEPEEPKKRRGPKDAFLAATKLFLTPDMAMLSGLFIFTGMALSFYSGVYSAAVAFTEKFGEDRTRFVGISGMLIGVGGMIGGMVIGAVGNKVTIVGRSWIVIIGAIIKLTTYGLIFVNIPKNAVFGHTSDEAYIESQIWLAITCSFLLGLGYSCYNTQIYALVGTLYSTDSAPAFALYKFVQSLAAAGAFFYTSHLNLHVQLVMLSVLCLIGTTSFCLVVRKQKD